MEVDEDRSLGWDLLNLLKRKLLRFIPVEFDVFLEKLHQRNVDVRKGPEKQCILAQHQETV